MKKQRLKAIIDSGVTKNFMFKTLIEKKSFLTRKKKDVYDLVVINGNSLPSKNGKIK